LSHELVFSLGHLGLDMLRQS